MIEKTDYKDCEDAGIDIPKKNFRSYFTWELYEATRSYEPLVMAVWFGGLLFYLYKAISLSHFWRTLLTVMILLVSIMWAPMICIICTKKRAGKLVSRNNEALAEAAKEVFSSEQETLAPGWDKVASKLNNTFHITGEWRTPYCIFDGEQCATYFRRYVFKPMYEQDESEGSEKSCLRTAVSIYQQKILDQFNWDKEDNSILAEDSLPAGSHRCKYTWRLKNFMSYSGSRVWFVVMLVYIFLHRTWPLRLMLIIEMCVLSVKMLTIYPVKLLATRNRIRLLATIANVAPGEDMDRWDVIAKRMNGYLTQDSRATAFDRFFDGKDCLRFFEKTLKPLMSKKITNDQVATYELLPLIAEAVEDISV